MNERRTEWDREGKNEKKEVIRVSKPGGNEGKNERRKEEEGSMYEWMKEGKKEVSK